jgi:CelD/BcsL family acetyltransferase involved in cellulose biosynthesis
MDVQAVGQLGELVPEWESLWRRVPNATPFQHPGWLLPWWETFGSGELFSFAVRDQGLLTGLALMFLHKWDDRRQVTFIGNGVSDRLDFIVENREGVAPILEAIVREKDRWDLCDLQDLAPNSDLLHTSFPKAIQVEICPQYTCMSVPLPLNLPHGLKRNLRRYRSHLEQVGCLQFETASPAQIDEYLAALFRLHAARWAMKDDEGMLNGSAMERFHFQAARNLFAAGLARLYALRLDGRIVAIVYAFIRGDRAFSYQGGFEPELKKFSPGGLVLEYAISQAMAEGAIVFDFLRGDEPYKADWGASKYISRRLRLWPA